MAILSDGLTLSFNPPKVLSSSSIQTRKPLFLLASPPDRKINNFQILKIEELPDRYSRRAAGKSRLIEALPNPR